MLDAFLVVSNTLILLKKILSEREVQVSEFKWSEDLNY
jgi:hypothetical protein